MTIYNYLHYQAQKNPNAIAIVSPDRQPLTYNRLLSQIDSVITQLSFIGISPRDRVVIALPNGPEMAVAFLAIASIATCAPLNPAYHRQEFDFYLSDFNAKALIVQSGVADAAKAVAKERGITIIELTPNLTLEAGIFTLNSGEPQHPVCDSFTQANDDDIALVLHTSGTTSRPKIVPLTHNNLWTSAQNICWALNLSESDSEALRRNRCLNIMPLFHIHGLIACLLSSLSAGASVICTTGFNAPQFFAWLDEFQPTWYSAVPTMHQSILAKAELNKQIIISSPLRLIRSSSASLAPQVMTDIETTFNVTSGYENNPIANKEAFTQGWFRTGDLGYLDDDNYLFLQGRIKEIINRGGEKISPREIDEVLREHPAISQVVTKENLSKLSIQKYSQNLSNFQQFNCYLIGHESLLIPCAESLLERGYQILGIISSGSLIKNWTESRGIPHIRPTDDLFSILSEQAFDYLFSIHNLSILSEEILELPRQYAINCHDSLLPKYGGINAPSWAILNQEKTHGVTWHKMTNLVDQGEIFKQIPINIAKDETAFTLNGKCYEIIINSFAQLIKDLASNQVVLTKQSPNHRSYFLRSQKPSPGCLLSWKHSAYEIDALIRALDFGFYQNFLGLPKLAIGTEFIIITKIKILDDLSNSPPGIITAIAANYLKLSTIDYDILLDQILTIDGQYLSIDEFVRKFKLQLGDQFKDIDPNIAKQIKKFETLLVKHETFWINKLATLQPIAIPYARQIQVLRSPTSEIKTKDWFVPNEVTKFLESHLKSGCLENFIVAAFAAYLARISQSCCFDLGLRWNELQNQLAGLEDFFACEVPCRIDIGYEQSFAEVFKAVNWQIELVKQHKTYSRDIVVRYPELQTIRKLNYNSRFPVLVELVEKLDTHKTRAANPLTFVVPKAGNKCCFVYDDEAFNNDSITRIVEQFTIFVRSIVTDPNRCLANLQLLSDDELYKVLVQWNNTEVAYPQHKCIHHLFEDQVERTPDAVAIVFKKQQLTYRELNNRANQLAHYLQALGVKPERLVGICVERSIEMLVGLLGILKAGGVYIPLDPTYPKERLNYMVSDGQISLLLTQEKFQHQFTTKGVDQIFLDRDESAIAQKSQANLVSQVTPNNLAYIIYTSGSTGKPKGVTIEHRSLVNFTQAAIFEYGLNDTDSPAETLPERILQFASISFDTAAEEIYPCLISGATLVLRIEEMLTSVATFLKTCQDWQLTVLDLPTAYWQQIVSELETTDVKLPESLRLVIIGGERVLPESVKIWQESVGKFPQLVNTYGPTEGTVVATTYKVTTSIIGNSVPIGRPITNTQIYILDHYLQPVPIGVPGELFIGGDGLARCYLNRLELTAEKFIFNPFRQGKLYKTGDIARYLLDGNIEFIGRIDNQVKIRGFRIELGEIEAVMGEHPYILNVVVIAREDIPGDKRLIAYIVSQPQATLNQSELRQFLKQKLSEYMIPSAFVFLEKFPLTPNGKIDRRALPTPEQIRLEPEESFVAPRNELEQQLTKVWEAILGIKPIGVRDNFFALGGHSLLAVKLFTQIEKTFRINLPLAAIFHSPTVEQLADIICSQGWTSPCYSLVPLQPKGSRPILFGIHHIYFQDLIRCLGEEQPVYGLHYGISEPNDKALSLPKMEDLAAHYIEEMRSLQPQGPYFLMGLSIGGIVAYEMAQQLVAQGQEVALLALFDTLLKRSQAKLLPLSQRLKLLLNLELWEFWQRFQFQIKIKFNRLLARYSPKTNMTEPIKSQYFPHIYTDYPMELLRNAYTPKSYSGTVVLFKAINSSSSSSISYSFEPPEVTWRKLGDGELVIYKIPGNHLTILEEPNVQILAEKLTHCIDKALVNHSS